MTQAEVASLIGGLESALTAVETALISEVFGVKDLRCVLVLWVSAAELNVLTIPNVIIKKHLHCNMLHRGVLENERIDSVSKSLKPNALKALDVIVEPFWLGGLCKA